MCHKLSQIGCFSAFYKTLKENSSQLYQRVFDAEDFWEANTTENNARGWFLNELESAIYVYIEDGLTVVSVS